MPRPMPTLAALVAALPLLAGADDPRLAPYRVAPGYKLQIAATEPMVINPVAMTFGLDGRLFVIEWLAGGGPNDRIRVLTDKDGDSTFDESSIYMDKLELPAGLLFWDGWTYITLGHEVVRFRDEDGDSRFEKREVIVSGFGNDNSHHRVSGLTMGPDGWIYITTGDSDARAKGSDGSTATVLRSGGVFRCRPDGSGLEDVAFGMRNPFGNVAFDDEFHIFHTDNDNEGSAGFTGCRILHVVEGGDYGWRLREGARCCQPDFDRATWNGGRPGRLGWVAETGRGAPAGLCVLNSAAFPPSTRNLLVYPDVFRRSVRVYKLKPAGATYTVDKEFELLGSSEGVFRPDDAEIGPDGALYILDWRTDSGGAGPLAGNGKLGRIYRLTWGGTVDESARTTMPRDRFAKLASADEPTLLANLKTGDYGLRNVSGLELLRRLRAAQDRLHRRPLVGALSYLLTRKRAGQEPAGDIAWMSSLERKISDIAGAYPRTAPSEGRRHAMMLIGGFTDMAAQAGNLAFNAAWIGGTGDRDPVVRRLALEGIARSQPRSDAQWAYFVIDDGAPDDPQVRRAWAFALSRFNAIRRAEPGDDTDWLKALGDADRRFGRPDAPFDVQTDLDKRMEIMGKRSDALQARLSADMLAETILELTVTQKGNDPFLREAYTRALERLGHVGLDATIRRIKTGDEIRAAAALYVLQGWRSTDGLAALMSEATTRETIPDEARAGLFRALREMGPIVPPEPIVEWLEGARGDASARVAAIKVLAAMKDRGMLAVPKVVPPLLGDADAGVRRAALELAAVFRSEAIKVSLLALIANEQKPADERGLAIVALRGYAAKDLTPPLLAAFEASKNSGLRAELLRTLAAADFRAATSKAEALLKDPDLNLRSAAIAILGQKPETALIVARRYNDGTIPAEDLPRVIEAIRSHASPEIQAATQRLLRSKLLAAPKGAEARRLRDYVARRGNPERGRAIYLDAKKGGCAACHRLEGVGQAVGPDLTRVHETLDFDKRVEAILEPSKEIKEGYATFKIATADGRTLAGLLVADTPEGVTLRDAQGKEVKIPAREIDQKGTDRTSLMPAGVVGHLSFDELADLLAFLGDRKAQEALRPKE